MDCRRCEVRSRSGPPRDDPTRRTRVWGADRISGLRCERCGDLLGVDDIARLLLDKESQLERFGLLRAPPHPDSNPPPTRALHVVRTEKD